jgi:hypothetical protein
MGECERKNRGKNRLGLISPISTWWLGEVYTYGSVKYADRNWEKGGSFTDFLDCAERHLVKWKAGHRDDEESGLHHLAHALWNIGALLHMDSLPERYGEFDDRPTYCADAIPNCSDERMDVDEEDEEPTELELLQGRIAELESALTKLVYGTPEEREGFRQILKDMAYALEAGAMQPKHPEGMKGLVELLTTNVPKEDPDAVDPS